MSLRFAGIMPANLLPFTADLNLSFGSVAAGLIGVVEEAHAQASVATDGVRSLDDGRAFPLALDHGQHGDRDAFAGNQIAQH